MTAFSRFTAAELRTAEAVLCQALEVMTEARHEQQIVEARRLPCGGGCQIITWQQGAWACPAINHETDLSCQLQEHLIGPHVHCNPDSDDPAQHNVLRWTDPKQEVA